MKQAAGLGGLGLVGSSNFRGRNRIGVLEARSSRLPDLPAWPWAWGRAPSLPGAAGVRSTIHCTVEAWGGPSTAVGLTWVSCSGYAEIRLGKNRTEAEVKRYTEEKERLERKKEEIRSHLAQLRREKRELKESLSSCAGVGQGAGRPRTAPGWGVQNWGEGAWTPHAAILSQGQ